MRHGAHDSKDLEDLQYKLDGATVRKRRAWNTVTSLQSQSSSVQSVIEGYRQRMPECMECFRGDTTNNFSVIVMILLRRLST